MTGPHLIGLSFHSPLSLPPPVPTGSRFVPFVPSALTCREWTYVFGGSMTSYLFLTFPNPPFANLKELESLQKHSSNSQQHQYINIKPKLSTLEAEANGQQKQKMRFVWNLVPTKSGKMKMRCYLWTGHRLWCNLHIGPNVLSCLYIICTDI